MKQEVKEYFLGLTKYGMPYIILIFVLFVVGSTDSNSRDIDDIYDILAEPGSKVLTAEQLDARHNADYWAGHYDGYNKAMDEMEFAPEGKPSNEYNEIEEKYVEGWNEGYEVGKSEYKISPGKCLIFGDAESKICWEDNIITYEGNFTQGAVDFLEVLKWQFGLECPDCGMMHWEECEVVIPCILSGTPGLAGAARTVYESGYTKGYSFGWNEGFTECDHICQELLDECGYER